MRNEITLRPLKGLRVIDPATCRALPETGATVRDNFDYWIRRINDGDVIEVDASEATATDAPKATPKLNSRRSE